MILNNKTNIIIRISLIIIVLLMTICGPEKEYKFPVIKMSILSIGLGLALLLLFIFTYRGKIRYLQYDIISCVLFARVVYYFFLVLKNENTEYLSHYMAIILSFIAYIVAINTDITLENILFVFELIVLISGLQTILAISIALLNGIPMYMLKSQIVTPIGASNMLAVIWIFFLPFIYKLEHSKIKKNFFFFFIIVLTLLSRSNTGIIMLTLEILVLLFSEKKYKLFKILGVGIIAYVAIVFIVNNANGYFNRISNSLQNIVSGNENNIEETFNGRMELYKIAIILIKEKPIIGYSFNYRNLMPGNMMAHNWIFEALLSGGLISLILSITSYVLSIKMIFMKSKDSLLRKSLIIGISITLIQGLFEPSFGGMFFELLFWLTIGAAIRSICKDIRYGEKHEYNKKNNKDFEIS